MSFACKPICGLNLHRPHFSCGLFCRSRRYFYGKMNKSKYHYNKCLGVVLSNNPDDMEKYTLLFPSNSILGCPYVIFVDKLRRFARVKDIFLKRLLKVLEKERSYSEPLWVRIIVLYRKRIATICEFLAN
jgi:hypothetical protein